jgi:ATP-dependent Clp protease protease subunit
MPGIHPTVISKVNGEKGVFDLFSRLLAENIIFVGGPDGSIDTASANEVIAELLYLASEDPAKEITMYINSPGGMVTAGLAIYDTMQFVKNPISTVCVGMAMSFGAVLLAAGSKGRRMALPNSRIMIHQPLIYGGGISGQVTDINIEAEELQRNKNRLLEILANHTGKSVERVRQDCERNCYLSAEEAMEYGLIDSIVKCERK